MVSFSRISCTVYETVIFVSVKLGIHIRVCVYVMRPATYDFSAFEYHA